MRLCRVGPNKFGLVRGDGIHDVSQVLESLVCGSYPLPGHDLLVANLERLRRPLEAAADVAEPVALSNARFLSPVANPGKIIAAPVNYQKHLEEAQADPAIHHQKQIDGIRKVGLFLKATSSLIGPGEPVAIRHPDRRNDHEIELVAIIGKTADRVAPEAAFQYIAGYSIGLDMTVRGPEERSLRKSIDSFSVLGPWLVTVDEFSGKEPVDMELRVNGELRQKASTRDLVMGIAELISFASSFYTLHPGDLLFTGTPEGVGPVEVGDRISASIEGIGTMMVEVTQAKAGSASSVEAG